MIETHEAFRASTAAGVTKIRPSLKRGPACCVEGRFTKDSGVTGEHGPPDGADTVFAEWMGKDETQDASRNYRASDASALG